jgi:acetyl-CoA C-acetyltransferase
MPQRRDAAIVGIYEYPLRVAPGVSPLQIKAESASRALEDAGLTWADVDGVYDTGGDQGIGGLGIAEYFGMKPRLIDTTYVGGSSFEFQANHARAMIAAGKCNVALLTYGSAAHSDRRAIGTAGATGVGPATPVNNMEDPWGLTCSSTAPPMSSSPPSPWPRGGMRCVILRRSRP